MTGAPAVCRPSASTANGPRKVRVRSARAASQRASGSGPPASRSAALGDQPGGQGLGRRVVRAGRERHRRRRPAGPPLGRPEPALDRVAQGAPGQVHAADHEPDGHLGAGQRAPQGEVVLDPPAPHHRGGAGRQGGPRGGRRAGLAERAHAQRPCAGPGQRARRRRPRRRVRNRSRPRARRRGRGRRAGRRRGRRPARPSSAPPARARRPRARRARGTAAPPWFHMTSGRPASAAAAARVAPLP